MLSKEEKLNLMTQIGLNADEVASLLNCSKSKAYSLMNICRNEFNGQAGIMTRLITPTSLCKALGTSLEEEIYKLKM